MHCLAKISLQIKSSTFTSVAVFIDLWSSLNTQSYWSVFGSSGFELEFQVKIKEKQCQLLTELNEHRNIIFHGISSINKYTHTFLIELESNLFFYLNFSYKLFLDKFYHHFRREKKERKYRQHRIMRRRWQLKMFLFFYKQLKIDDSKL